MMVRLKLTSLFSVIMFAVCILVPLFPETTTSYNQTRWLIWINHNLNVLTHDWSECKGTCAKTREGVQPAQWYASCYTAFGLPLRLKTLAQWSGKVRSPNIFGFPTKMIGIITAIVNPWYLEFYVQTHYAQAFTVRIGLAPVLAHSLEGYNP